MLKRTLVSAAVLTSLTAFAADDVLLKVSPQARVGQTPAAVDIASAGETVSNYSIEGSASLSDIQMPNFVVKTSGADYAIGSTFTLDLDVALTADLKASDITLFSSGTTAVFNSIDADNGVVVIGITEAMDSELDAIVIGGLTVPRADAVAKDKVSAKLSASAATDSALHNDTLSNFTDFKNQFAVTFTALDAFVTSTGKALNPATDSASVAVVDNGSSLVYPATADGQVTVLSGDLAWLRADATTRAATIATTGAGSASGADVFTGSSVTTTDTSGAGDVVFTFAPASNTLTNGALAHTALPTTPFNISASVKYDTHGTNFAGTTGSVAGEFSKSSSVGAFDFNGAKYIIRSLPTGDTVENFVWAENNGAAALNLTFTITADGKTFGPYSAGSVGAKDLHPIGTDITAALIDAGVNDAGDRVSVTITASDSNGTTGSVANFNIYAAYKVVSANDRLALTVEKVQ